MSNMRRHTLQLTCLGLLLLGATDSAFSQVGHAPGSSPYRDLRGKYFLTLTGGYAWGSGGKVNVGPAHGPVFGPRLDIHLAGPGAVHFGLNWAHLDRQMIDPSAEPENRLVETAKQTVIMADMGLYLVFTGEKTWHGVAPYFGASLGLALGGKVAGDTLSAFDFSTKFMVSPGLGFRWHPGGRLFVRFEARDVLWKLSYPSQFFEADPPVLDPAVNKASEWTHNPMLTVSLGFSLGR